MNSTYKYKRSANGFTLYFALILCVAFSSLLLGIFYFIKANAKQSYRDVLKLQASYLAEAGNSRAISRLNVKNLPDYEFEEEDTGEDEEDDFFDDDDSFFDDEDDDDDFFDDAKDEEYNFFADRENLAKIPRYINFYHKDAFFVNVDSGHVITSGQYHALAAQQKASLLVAKEQGQNIENVLLVEEVYFPLPEVNVQLLGSIPIPRGTHLKPGFKIILANKIPIQLKQNDIREEYLNVSLIEPSGDKPVLRNISPNYSTPGEVLEIVVDGDNVEDLEAVFSVAGIQVLNYDSGILEVSVADDVKPGKYRLRIGSLATTFYVVPPFEGSPQPYVNNVLLKEPIDGNTQFIKINNSKKLDGLKITGGNLGSSDNIPMIVPDAAGLEIDLISFKDTEIVFNISAKHVTVGTHHITVFNKGGQSYIWTFAVEEAPVDETADPNLGVYSTVLTLLEVESLSNLSLGQPIGDTGGRPQSATGSKRPDAATDQAGLRQPRFQQSFDLLKSDMETVWKVETVATVNKVSYKETAIIIRKVPRIKAALTTNSGLSFAVSEIAIRGVQQARSILEQYSSTGDTTLVIVKDDEVNQRTFNLTDKDSPSTPTGSAVIENLNFGNIPRSPAALGFKPGGIVAVIPPSARAQYTDFSIVDSLGSTTITVKEPGFAGPHFLNDEVVQFIPSVITPRIINERDAQGHLEPQSSYIRDDNKEIFENVFSTRLIDIENWTDSRTNNTSVPSGIYEDYRGYFGLSIVEGSPNYSGANVLAGQGVLIVDTTLGGINPAGGTVRLGKGSKDPARFDGVIYIFGDLEIAGDVEINGAIVVNSPHENSTIDFSGGGSINYNLNSIRKSIIDLPFTRQLRSRMLESVKSQEEFLKANGSQ